jgi:DNA-binding NarL/FixJ family response regulator
MRGGIARLTSRKRDVVRLVADGMRNQDVAFRLNLSEHTVRNYLIRIFDKLEISSRDGVPAGFWIPKILASH